MISTERNLGWFISKPGVKVDLKADPFLTKEAVNDEDRVV